MIKTHGDMLRFALSFALSKLKVRAFKSAPIKLGEEDRHAAAADAVRILQYHGNHKWLDDPIPEPEEIGFYSQIPLRMPFGPEKDTVSPMCNLYSLTKGQAAIIAVTRAMRDSTGNLPPLPGIFPDYMAPIVRTGDGGIRELVMARWGMPGPTISGGYPVTNIRNTKSPHWRRWLGVEHRCVVPFTSFCEYEDTKPRKTPTWFARSDDRPLAFFAGIWTMWTGTRGTKANSVEGEHQLFGFLTCEPNTEVGAIHPKAMPAILTTPEEIDRWLTAPWGDAVGLQRPLPDSSLRVVASGERQDWL